LRIKDLSYLFHFSKRKNVGDEEPKKWAHMNCMIKLYGKRPEIDPYDTCIILETDVLANGKCSIWSYYMSSAHMQKL